MGYYRHPAVFKYDFYQLPFRLNIKIYGSEITLFSKYNHLGSNKCVCCCAYDIDILHTLMRSIFYACWGEVRINKIRKLQLKAAKESWRKIPLTRLCGKRFKKGQGSGWNLEKSLRFSLEISSAYSKEREFKAADGHHQHDFAGNDDPILSFSLNYLLP